MASLGRGGTAGGPGDEDGDAQGELGGMGARIREWAASADQQYRSAVSSAGGRNGLKGSLASAALAPPLAADRLQNVIAFHPPYLLRK